MRYRWMVSILAGVMSPEEAWKASLARRCPLISDSRLAWAFAWATLISSHRFGFAMVEFREC